MTLLPVVSFLNRDGWTLRSGSAFKLQERK